MGPNEAPKSEFQPAEVYMRQVLDQINTEIQSGMTRRAVHPLGFNGKGEQHGVEVVADRENDTLVRAEISIDDFTPQDDPNEYSNFTSESLEVDMRSPHYPAIRLESLDEVSVGQDRQRKEWVKLMTVDGVIQHFYNGPDTKQQQVTQATYRPQDTGYARARAQFEADVASFTEDAKRRRDEIIQMNIKAISDQARRN